MGLQQFNNSNSNQLTCVKPSDQISAVPDSTPDSNPAAVSAAFTIDSPPSSRVSHKSPVAAPRQPKDIQTLSAAALYENIAAVVNRSAPSTGLTPPSRCSGYSSGSRGSSENDLIGAQLDSIHSIDAIPDDLTSLTVCGLAECLKLFELPNVAHKFKQHQIDGQFFNIMSDHMFKDENFAFSEFEILKLKKLRDGWRPRLA